MSEYKEESLYKRLNKLADEADIVAKRFADEDDGKQRTRLKLRSLEGRQKIYGNMLSIHHITNRKTQLALEDRKISLAEVKFKAANKKRKKK